MKNPDRTVRGVKAPPPRPTPWVPALLTAVLSCAYLVVVGTLQLGF